MTSRSLYFKMTREYLKRHLWLVALNFLIFFFTYPVAGALKMSLYETRSKEYWTMADKIQDAVGTVGLSNGFVSFMMVALAVVCGVASFSYLHSKKQVDFYHSIPIRREKLYLVNFVGGILSLLLPYLINLGLAVLVLAAYGVGPSDTAVPAGISFLLHMVFFIMMYATTVVAMMMTGNRVIGILGTMVFFFYGPMIYLLTEGCYSIFFVTHYSIQSSDFGQYLSPLMAYIATISAENGGQAAAGLPITLLVAFLVSVILAVAGMLLYRKRPMEAAGRAMAFSWTMAPIKCLIVVPVAIAGYIIFYVMRGSDAWGVFGLLCGLLICYAVFEIIYHFDFRKLFAHRLQLGGCLVAALLITGIFRFDLMGYDSYLPDKEDVESVAVSMGRYENWVDYRTIREKTGDRWEENFNYVYDKEYVLEHMRMQEMEGVYALAQEGISRSGDLRQRRYENYYSSGEGNEVDVYVKYRLKNGAEKTRRYLVLEEKFKDTIGQISDNTQYKEGTYPLLDQTPADIAGVNYKELDAIRQVKLGDTAREELLTTYQRELTALTTETRKEEAPIGLIQFKTVDTQRMINSLKAAGDQSWTDFNEYCYYPVYPSFEGTIRLLREGGVTPGEMIADDQIRKLVVSPYLNKRDTDYTSMQTDIAIDDRDQIKALMDVMVCRNYLEYDLFYEVSEDLSSSVYIEIDGQDNTYSYWIKDELIPGFLQKIIDEARNMPATEN